MDAESHRIACPQQHKRFADLKYKVYCCFCEQESIQRRVVPFGEGNQVEALAPFLERDALEQLLKVSESLAACLLCL